MNESPASNTISTTPGRISLEKLVDKIRFFAWVCISGTSRLLEFGAAVVFTIAVPCLPVIIEWYRTGDVRSDTYYLVAAVLAAAFAVSAERRAFFGLYVTSFVINLILDMVHGPFSGVVDQWAGMLLAGVCVLHVSERAWWHIVLDRPFPDRLVQ
jgi:hypothetical protein